MRQCPKPSRLVPWRPAASSGVARFDPEAIRAFTRSMLPDLQALERIIAEGSIESGVRRIGVEQEMFLVDRGWLPAPVAMEMLARLGEGGYTRELARFNLEVNLEPLRLAGDCFRALEQNLREVVEKARRAAKEEGADVSALAPSRRLRIPV